MRHIVTLGLLLAAVGCSRSNKNASGDETTRSNIESARTEPDNTRVNERDRDTSAVTPGDQGGSEADRTATQQIRQLVMKQDGLSMDAKNAKIITANGVVTLRGPVASAEEKATIERLATQAPGVKRIENQLEVKTQQP